MASFKIKFTPTEKGKFCEMSDSQIVDLSVEVCKAGSDVIKQHMIRTSPHPHLTPQIRVTPVYSTPSDGAMTSKVYMGGYIPLRKGRKYWLRYNKKGGTAYKTTEGVSANFLSILFLDGRPNWHPFPIRDAFLRKIPQKAVESAMLKAFNKEMERMNKQ